MARISTSNWVEISVSRSAITGFHRIGDVTPIDQTMIYGLTEVVSTSGTFEVAFGVFELKNVLSEDCIVLMGDMKIYFQISSERENDLVENMIDCNLAGEFPEFCVNEIDSTALKFDVLLL